MSSSSIADFSIRSPENDQTGGNFINNLLGRTTDSIANMIIKALDENKVDVGLFLLKNSKISSSDYCINTGSNQRNILHLLGYHSGNSEVQEILLKILSSDTNLKKSLCQQDKQGNTPCHLILSESKRSDLVELCAKKGCDLKLQNVNKISILTDTEKRNTESEIFNKSSTIKKFTDKNRPADNSDSIFNKKTDVTRTQDVTVSEVPRDLNAHFGAMINEFNKSSVRTDESNNVTETEKNHVGGEYNSQEILDMLMNDKNGTEQTGGKKTKTKSKKVSGYRRVNTYSEYSDVSPDSDDGDTMVRRLSRSVDNKGNQLHEETLEKIKKIVKELEPKLTDDALTLKARAYKAILYSRVKESHPSVSNIEKAQELLKESTEENIKKIKKSNSAKLEELEKYLTEKDKMRSERTPMNSENDKKEKRVAEKKTTKKTKKESSEMSGGFSSDSNDDDFRVGDDVVMSVVDFSENY